MKTQIVKKTVGLLAGVGLLVGVCSNADAALELTFDNGNAAIAGYPGPYGKLVLDLVDSTHLTVTLTSFAGFNFSEFGLNLNATTFTSDSLTGNGGGTFAVGSGNQDGFGSFNFTVTETPTGFPGSSSMSVNIVNTSGTWATVNDVLTPGNKGAVAAGHVIVLNADGSAAIVTGYSSAGGVVPEPATIIAGALLLLPFGASTIRILRRNRQV